MPVKLREEATIPKARELGEDEKRLLAERRDYVMQMMVESRHLMMQSEQLRQVNRDTERRHFLLEFLSRVREAGRHRGET